MPNWKGHIAKCEEVIFDSAQAPADSDLTRLREHIELWLAALMQTEHLALLIGNGLTTATALGLKATPARMEPLDFAIKFGEAVKAFATKTAASCGRGTPNLEDDLRAVQTLLEGLRVLCCQSEEAKAEQARALAELWGSTYAAAISGLVQGVAKTEREIASAWKAAGGHDASGLTSFLLSFASRPPSRDRLEVFTLNYDRLLEYACERLGLRVLDRFVGSLEPRFRASRLNVDVHFDPPGIRGEPRYLEGVLRLTKLHGSLDWRWCDRMVLRAPMPFGPDDATLGIAGEEESVLIYPNAAKDMETLAYPYAELFRDMAAATCRPNVALFVFGYSFGDDHVNRVLRDMLTISSTHLIIISYDDCGGRLERFLAGAAADDQVTLLVGKHFGHLKTLVTNYLPRTVVEPVVQNRALLRARRSQLADSSPGSPDKTLTGGA